MSKGVSSSSKRSGWITLFVLSAFLGLGLRSLLHSSSDTDPMPRQLQWKTMEPEALSTVYDHVLSALDATSGTRDIEFDLLALVMGGGSSMSNTVAYREKTVQAFAQRLDALNHHVLVLAEEKPAFSWSQVVGPQVSVRTIDKATMRDIQRLLSLPIGCLGTVVLAKNGSVLYAGPQRGIEPILQSILLSLPSETTVSKRDGNSKEEKRSLDLATNVTKTIQLSSVPLISLSETELTTEEELEAWIRTEHGTAGLGLQLLALEDKRIAIVDQANRILNIVRVEGTKVSLYYQTFIQAADILTIEDNLLEIQRSKMTFGWLVSSTEEGSQYQLPWYLMNGDFVASDSTIHIAYPTPTGTCVAEFSSAMHLNRSYNIVTGILGVDAIAMYSNRALASRLGDLLVFCPRFRPRVYLVHMQPNLHSRQSLAIAMQIAGLDSNRVTSIVQRDGNTIGLGITKQIVPTSNGIILILLTDNIEDQTRVIALNEGGVGRIVGIRGDSMRIESITADRTGRLYFLLGDPVAVRSISQDFIHHELDRLNQDGAGSR